LPNQSGRRERLQDPRARVPRIMVLPNAMLLNEFLKEHREVQELKKQVVALTVSLQKVSAQFELNKPAPQTVLNRQ
jgi:hypothetical protein